MVAGSLRVFLVLEPLVLFGKHDRREAHVDTLVVVFVVVVLACSAANTF